MNTPMELTHDYIATHDLRDASATIYFGSTRALLRHFGQTVSVEAITHRAVLAWRKKVLANGLSKQSWNTYSNHMRTVWGYAIEQGTLTCTTINPFKKTAVIPPRRSSKTIDREAIRTGREWLKSLVIEEESTHQRSQITPAWFWLAVYEMFYYSGIRLNGLLNLRYRDINWENGRIYVRAETEKTHREYAIPIAPGLEPHLQRLMNAADNIGFLPDDQLFNVNRFSIHYRSKTMNTDQVEGDVSQADGEIQDAHDPAPFQAHLGNGFDASTRTQYPPDQKPAEPLQHRYNDGLYRGRLRRDTRRAASAQPGSGGNHI